MPRAYATVQVDQDGDQHIVHFKSPTRRKEWIQANPAQFVGIHVEAVQASELSKEDKASSLELDWGWDIGDRLKKAGIIDFEITRCSIEKRYTKHVNGVCQSCIQRRKLLYVNVLRDEFADEVIDEESYTFRWNTKHATDTRIVDLRKEKLPIHSLMEYISQSLDKQLEQDTYLVINTTIADNPLFKDKVIGLMGYGNLGIYALRWYYGDHLHNFIDTSQPPHW